MATLTRRSSCEVNSDDKGKADLSATAPADLRRAWTKKRDEWNARRIDPDYMTGRKLNELLQQQVHRRLELVNRRVRICGRTG